MARKAEPEAVPEELDPKDGKYRLTLRVTPSCKDKIAEISSALGVTSPAAVVEMAIRFFYDRSDMLVDARKTT